MTRATDSSLLIINSFAYLTTLLLVMANGESLADSGASQIRLGARLSTQDPSRTPVLSQWTVSWTD